MLERCSIFESMRSYNKEIFKLDEHLERLDESARTLGVRLSEKEIINFKNKIESAHKKSAVKNAYIRIAVPLLSRKPQIIIKNINPYPQKFYKKGISIMTAVTRRQNALASFVKSSDYLPGISAVMDTPGDPEAIMLNERGFVSEATVSNIFIVKDRRLLTPFSYAALLNGITRQHVFNLAAALDINVIEQDFTRHDVYNADECFLTNTTMEIMPVVRVDKRKIGKGKPGKITKELMKRFHKVVPCD